MTRTIGVVLKGYPRLSETFIAHEIRGLERAGFALRLIALRRPTDRARHPVHDEIEAPVSYLPEYLWREPVRVVRAWVGARRLAGYRAARRAWLADLRRDPTPNRVRRFGQALVLAHELAPGLGWLHAHFLHTPASVARYAALAAGLSWSASAHAKDVWTTPDWEIAEKLAGCRWLVTCTAANAARLKGLAPDPARVALVYHGLDFARFPLRPPADDGPDGGDAARPVVIVSVGRAVAKKGYPVLLEALARLPGHLHWRFVHLGGGPEAAALGRQARRLGLARRIDWRGPRPQGEVLTALREGHVFALASLIATDGDRDGLPNVLMEAQSQGLACVASRVSGVPELIADGETGLLVPAGDVEAFSRALADLIEAPRARVHLARAAQARLAAAFDFEAGLRRIAGLFADSAGRPAGAGTPEEAPAPLDLEAGVRRTLGQRLAATGRNAGKD